VKRGKWQFVVKTCHKVSSVAIAHPLCWLVSYLKSSVFFWTQVYTEGASSRSNLHAGCHWNEDNFAIYALHW